MTEKLKRLWKNDYFQTVVTIVILIALVAGMFFGSKLILNTDYPLLTVESGSMCIPYGARCDGWSHPFDRTLHVGDIIIVQGVDPLELNTNYPYSDIIVFHDPYSTDTLIVHRIISVQEIDGKLYFHTKGDGNSIQDPWIVSQDKIVGKVVGRIPWIGNITLFIRFNSWALPVIIVLILIIMLLEFVYPLKRSKKKVENNETQSALYRCIYKKIRLIQVTIVSGASKRGKACQKSKLQ